MKPKEVIKLLNKDGWFEKNQRGSHKYFIHKVKPGKIPVPMHNTDLKIKTLNSILEQAGLK